MERKRPVVEILPEIQREMTAIALSAAQLRKSADGLPNSPERYDMLNIAGALDDMFERLFYDYMQLSEKIF